MRKSSRMFESGGDQVNLYDILDGIRKYWPRFILVFVVALALSYAYFLKTLPAPHSRISVKIGFNSVKTGKYPDGSIFNQNDLIRAAVVKAAFDGIGELKNSNRWTPASIKDSLYVTPIYPLDLQMAKNQLANENSKLTQAEIQSNYDKLMYYASSEYLITFNPAPAMPLALQERVLAEIVKQFTELTLREHLPLSVTEEDYIGDSLLAQQSYYPAYEYFTRTVKAIGELAAANPALLAGNPETSRMEDKQAAHTGGRLENRVVSLTALESKLKGIRAQLDTAEYSIFDEKSLPDISFVKKMLEMEIADTRIALETKKKQAEYKVYLASIPINGLAQGPGAESQGGIKGGVTDKEFTKTVVDMLLTYTNQYYRMINEADAINTEAAALQVQLSRLQEELNRLEIPYSGKEPIEGRMEKLAASLKGANELIRQTLAWEAKEIKGYFSKNQPPVMNYFIVQGMNAMPLTKVFLVGLGCTLAFMVVQVAVYVVTLAGERQKKLADVMPVQSPQIHRKG